MANQIQNWWGANFLAVSPSSLPRTSLTCQVRTSLPVSCCAVYDLLCSSKHLFSSSPVQLLGGNFAHSTINSSTGRKPLTHSICNTSRTRYLNNHYLFSLILVHIYYTPTLVILLKIVVLRQHLSRDFGQFWYLVAANVHSSSGRVWHPVTSTIF
jgi:hypothetical protein